MKKRILILILAMILLIGVVTGPAEAATRSDVYNCFKLMAMSGTYNAYNAYYGKGYPVEDSVINLFSVNYWTNTGIIELTGSDNTAEVTLVLDTAMRLPYKAYVRYYDSQLSTGTVYISASYNGESFANFVSFEGDASNARLKGNMLKTLNERLPFLMEYIRLKLFENGMSLRDMGLTSFQICNLHCWIPGAVSKQPSCTEPGLQSFQCANCGVVESHAIPALGHVWTFDALLTRPTGTDTHNGTGRYHCSRCGANKVDRLCAENVFSDMPDEDHWAHNAIDWAFFGGITSGTTPNTFSPDMTITRSQAVTFLWAAAGKPEPETTVNPFTDVTNSDYFYKPVLWAREKGVTSGTGPNTFGPYEVCTRSQIVTFLWAAANKPNPKSTTNTFVDVAPSDYFYRAVLWAKENGITSGTATDTFGSYDVCTRAQVVTFLYKASMVPAG